MKQKIITYVKNHPKNIAFLFWIYNHILGFNRIMINSKNSIDIGAVLLNKTTFIVKGINNTIIIKDLSRMKFCKININGNNNRIIINEEVYLCNTELQIEDNDNEISIGEHTSINGTTHLAAIEGTSIIIGNDCMFSSDIQFRTGDSHSIIDLGGNRLNISEDICIGNHVWIGTQVTCLKGVHIASNCIVGAGSLANKKFADENVILAGNPARVVKRQVNWLRERIL